MPEARDDLPRVDCRYRYDAGAAELPFGQAAPRPPPAGVLARPTARL